MNSTDLKSTIAQLEEAIKHIRPTYQLDVLCKALAILLLRYTKINIQITYARMRYK